MVDEPTTTEEQPQGPQTASEKRQQRIQLGDAARIFAHNKAAATAIFNLRRTWFRELMGSTVGDLTSAALHAKLQVLEALMTEIALLEGDGTNAAKGR